MHDATNHRQAQCQSVQCFGKSHGAVLGFLEAESGGDHADKNDEPPLLHEVRQAHNHQREGGQVRAEAAERVGELWYHLDQKNGRHNNGHDHHGGGVGHGLLDLGLELLGFLLVGRHPAQHHFQRTGGFTRGHEAAEEIVELPWVLGQRGCQARAGGHIVLDADHQFAHARLVQALGNDVETLHQRYTRFHHGGELPGENGNVRGLDRLAAATEQGLGLFLHRFRFDALGAQLGAGHPGTLGGNFTLRGASVAIDAVPHKYVFCRVGCHSLVRSARGYAVSNRWSPGVLLPGWSCP